jgi:hypothetical protein
LAQRAGREARTPARRAGDKRTVGPGDGASPHRSICVSNSTRRSPFLTPSSSLSRERTTRPAPRGSTWARALPFRARNLGARGSGGEVAEARHRQDDEPHAGARFVPVQRTGRPIDNDESSKLERDSANSKVSTRPKSHCGIFNNFNPLVGHYRMTQSRSCCVSTVNEGGVHFRMASVEKRTL